MKDLKAIIKQCFEDMYVIARNDVKQHFKEDKQRHNIWNHGRSLAFLHNVAKNPDMYFAPAYTNAEWSARVENFIDTDAGMRKSFQEHNANPEFKVYLRALARGAFVSGPFANVYANIYPVLQDRDLYNFCAEVQNFYYQGVLDVYANETLIKKYAKKISNWAEIVRKQNTISGRLMKRFVGGYERQYK